MRSPSLVLFLTALAACTGTDDTDETGETGNTTEEATAQLRVVHLSPEAPAVDVFANGGTPALITNLAFGSLEKITVPAATYDVDVSATGATPDDAVLEIDGVTLVGGTTTTAVAYGTLTDLRALAFVDNAETVPGGQVRYRISHTAAGVPTVDVWELTSGTKLLDNVAYGDSAVVEAAAGALVIGLDIDEDGSPDATFDVPALGDGIDVNVFAIADEEGPKLVAHLPDDTVAVVSPRPADAQVRVLHLSPDAPSVDVFVNAGATPSFSDVVFGESTAYAPVPPATYDFQVSAMGSPASAAVLNVNDLALAAGTRYTAVAYGNLSGITAMALEDDAEGIPTGNTRLQIGHAAPGAGEVDIWELTGPTKLVDDFAVGASTVLDVANGALSLGLDLGDDGVPDVTFAVPALGADQLVNVFAVIDDSGPALFAQFSDGTVVRVPAQNN